jgi:hypothetical protein
MARSTPLWQQNSSYTAGLDRLLMSALWPNGGAIMATPPSAVANTMNMSVPAGFCAVPMSDGTKELCRWDAAEIVGPLSPSAAQPRIDLIVCQVRDAALDAGANNDFLFAAVTGVPAASPVAPATPANAFGIVSVLVPAGVANLNTATITNLRSFLGTDPAWITMTPLQNGWTADGTVGPPQYRRINGLVYLRGGINGASMNSVLFTLPSTYRPASSMHFPVRATSSITLGQIQIQAPAGNILPNVSGSPTGSQFVSLYGVCFDPDGT